MRRCQRVPIDVEGVPDAVVNTGEVPAITAAGSRIDGTNHPRSHQLVLGFRRRGGSSIDPISWTSISLRSTVMTRREVNRPGSDGGPPGFPGRFSQTAGGAGPEVHPAHDDKAGAAAHPRQDPTAAGGGHEEHRAEDQVAATGEIAYQLAIQRAEAKRARKAADQYSVRGVDRGGIITVSVLLSIADEAHALRRGSRSASG
jgi:hypothetical protein